jgi:hypothetical protein
MKNTWKSFNSYEDCWFEFRKCKKKEVDYKITINCLYLLQDSVRSIILKVLAFPNQN